MQVSSVMSTKIYTATPETAVQELWKLLFTKHKNAIPVVDKNQKLIGIVTKEDLLEALYPNYEEYLEDIPLFKSFEEMEGKVKEVGNVKARQVMCKRVIYTRADTPIMRALSRMIVRRVNQLPVVSENTKVIGMITKGDIFRALFKKELIGDTKKQKKR
jgi:CBS domain-containing membrane protein